mgnify:FL=1
MGWCWTPPRLRRILGRVGVGLRPETEQTPSNNNAPGWVKVPIPTLDNNNDDDVRVASVNNKNSPPPREVELTDLEIMALVETMNGLPEDVRRSASSTHVVVSTSPPFSELLFLSLPPSLSLSLPLPLSLSFLPTSFLPSFLP